MTLRLLASVVAAGALASCALSGQDDDTAPEQEPAAPPARKPGPTAAGRAERPVRPYSPARGDVYPNAKRLAGRIAQRATTYRRGATARQVAATLPGSQADRRGAARSIEPVVHSDARSSGQVEYVQLSGVTSTTLGAMVAVRQVLRDDAGRARTETRVMDVRLHRTRGSWRLDRIESVGGRRVARPPDLPRAARRVLSNRRIDLFDSARWDIFRGYVDAGLLNALDAAARRHRLAVLTLRSGHPRNVWGTSRVSAHSKGFAADVYSIDGRLVVRQRRSGSRAHRLAKMLLDRGARQLGGPWVLGDGPPRSFTDEVHQDHLHLQQDAVR